MEHQIKAVKELRNGNILYGLVGSGKTRVAVKYYEEHEAPKDIYVITTAKKRDDWDWQKEFALIHVGTEESRYGKLHVDSWNNIMKYVDVRDAFFIFDEQRLIGNGAWVKAFQKIAKKNTHISVDEEPPNNWIMLSGTPGDTWMDYAPVFIANGFFKNITEFRRKHVVMAPYSKFPKIQGYLNEHKLEMLRNHILVEMPYLRHTIRHDNWTDVDYDKELFRKVAVNRWHVFEDRPIKDAAEMFRIMRKIVNSDPSRLEMVKTLQKRHKRLIVFYNFNYELEMLRTLGLTIPIAEWNGHKKEEIPDTEEWVYLVQYTAGAEGWNCTSTDAMAFWSLPYSYKVFEQAHGRIDRLDTKFRDLYYYLLVSHSVSDRGIKRSLEAQEDFQVLKFMREAFKNEPHTDELYGILE